MLERYGCGHYSHSFAHGSAGQLRSTTAQRCAASCCAAGPRLAAQQAAQQVDTERLSPFRYKVGGSKGVSVYVISSYYDTILY